MQENIFDKIREHIFRKEYDEAEKLLASLSKDKSMTADAITLTARLHGQSGNYTKALQMFDELELAWPDRFMILRLRINFLQEAGKIEDAADKAMQMTAKFPDLPDAYVCAAECFELAGKPLKAMEYADYASKRWPSDEKVAECVMRLEPLCKRQDKILHSLESVSEEMELSHCRLMADNDFIKRYLELFSGREGVYAKQTNSKSRKCGYVPVHESLGVNEIKTHLDGDQTLGIYLVKRDNSSRILAFDIDVCKPYLGSYLNDLSEKRRIKAALKKVAKELIAAAEAFGIRFLLESSGHKGLHLWAFSDFDLPARYWRVIGSWIAEQAVSVPPEVQIEMFPKQDFVSEKGLGNLIKLPLGIHQASGRRSLFLEHNTFKPFPIQKDALMDYEALSRSELEDILGKLTLAKAAQPEAIEEKKTVTVPCVLNEEAAPAPDFSLQVNIPLPKRFSEGVEQVLAGCLPLNNIMTGILQREELLPACRHVFVYVFASLGEEGKVFIHQILGQLPDYDPDQVNAEIKAVPPNPMSCGKLRKNIPEFAGEADCRCQFRLPEGCYASPVVHAGIFPGGKSFAKAAVPVSLSYAEELGGASGSIDRYMHEYKEVEEKIAALLQRREILKNRIDQFFKDSGKDEIVTKLAVYKRIGSELKEKISE
ncbi:MAG: hypothetical protein GX221_11755 [Candidatus Riflebacteria bacterium]|nr:hypothetical protein [Candidatus Riflebacteria bacterium]